MTAKALVDFKMHLFMIISFFYTVLPTVNEKRKMDLPNNTVYNRRCTRAFYLSNCE